MQHILERMENFRPVAQGFPESGSPLGHDHEFLKVDGGVRMGSSIDDVHHGDGQNLGVRSTQVFEKGKVELNGGGFCHGQGDAQDGVGPQAGFIGRAVQVDHDFVNGRLQGGIVP